MHIGIKGTDLFISNIFDGVRNHADAHVEEVGRRHFKHCLRKLLPVFVNFLQNTHFVITIAVKKQSDIDNIYKIQRKEEPT